MLTLGAGKTTLMAEESDILTAAGVVHATIVAHLPEEHAPDIAYRNLDSFGQDVMKRGVEGKAVIGP
jgi:hypothetical protein